MMIMNLNKSFFESIQFMYGMYVINKLILLFRMQANQMALYPNWLIVYVLRVIIPMLMLIIIAVKILLKSGREIQRAFDIKDVASLNMFSIV